MNSSNPIILCVDDEEMHLNLLETILTSNGYEVASASNGLEALLKIKSQTIDLVLCDIAMPGMDGFQATAAIRQREARTGGHLPIVAMTAHAMAGDSEHCLAAGMDDYLSKPIKMEELEAKLRRYLE